MNMRSFVVSVVVGWISLGTARSPARADGGSVLLSEKKSGYQVTVFTAPTPFRAGPVDVSVLVQDASTGQPLARSQVTILMAKPGRPATEYPATAEAATNKLLVAAKFELPEPGRWKMKVQVDGLHGRVVIDREVEAGSRLPQWPALWPWISWPALAIALFGVHQVLERRASQKVRPLRSGRPTAPSLG
jgi:hypothetical protein